MIADDQELIRTGFRLILVAEPDINVIGEAATGREAVTIARTLEPDVVLMDIRMPDIDGIEATRRILARDRQSPPKVLILTTFDLDEYVYDALRAGATGFLLKDLPAHQLTSAVRTVGDSDALLSPSITRRLIERFAAPPTPATPPPGIDELTPRELEVLHLLATGKTNAEIAAELIVGETTIKTHVTHPDQARSARPRPSRCAGLRNRDRHPRPQDPEHLTQQRAGGRDHTCVPRS